VEERARAGPLILGAYAILVLSLLSATPLWLDELLQLRGVGRRTWAELIYWVQSNPGASPLPYLLQEAAIRAFGFSTFVARLPAALCSILGGVAFFGICRLLKMERPTAALVLFLAVPLQFRYALEARGYSQALLFSLASLWLFLRLRETPSPRLAWAYGVSMALGLYSQPLTIFPALGQTIWALREPLRRLTALPFVLALLSFLPWFIAEQHVHRQVRTMDYQFFSARQIHPVVLLHDLAGGGYFTAIPLLALAVYALVAAGRRDDRVKLAGVVFVVSAAAPLATDAAFNYFFAPRQLLFAMPALVVLAAIGAATLWRSGWRWLAAAGAGLAFVSAAVTDYGLATRPKDDLGAAARVAQSWLTPDSCLTTSPPLSAADFVVYPELHASRICEARPRAARVVVVQSSYETALDKPGVWPALPADYRIEKETAVGSVRLRTYAR